MNVSLCVSVTIANSSVRYTEACTSSRQSASIGPEKNSSRMPHSGSKVQTCTSSSSSPLSSFICEVIWWGSAVIFLGLKHQWCKDPIRTAPFIYFLIFINLLG